MCVCPRMCLSSKFIYVYLVYIYLYYCHLQQSHRRKSKQTRTRPISKPAYPPQPGNIPLPRWSCHTVPLDLYYVPVGYDRMLLSECECDCTSAGRVPLLQQQDCWISPGRNNSTQLKCSWVTENITYGHEYELSCNVSNAGMHWNRCFCNLKSWTAQCIH